MTGRLIGEERETGLKILASNDIEASLTHSRVLIASHAHKTRIINYANVKAVPRGDQSALGKSSPRRRLRAK